jgi:hypothetical protein
MIGFGLGMKKKLSLLLCASVALVHCLLRVSAVEAASGVELKTSHYDLYVEKTDAGEVGRLAEAGYSRMAEFFRSEPNQRLRVEVYGTRDKYQNRLLSDTQQHSEESSEAAGCYAPETRKCYLWVQPNEYALRQTILHEIAHQFHFLAATTNERPRLWLYPEGIANYFGLHNWDGQSLRVGVIPAISVEDLPATALENFENKYNRNFKGLVTEKIKERDYAEAWAIMRFLIQNHHDACSTWMDKLNEETATFSQTHPLKAWNLTFSELTQQLPDDFESWLKTNQQPWKVVFGDWQEWGPTIEGQSKYPQLGLTVLKKTPRQMVVELAPQSTEARAGVVFGYKSGTEWYSLLVHGHELSLARKSKETEGEWVKLRDWVTDRTNRQDTIELKVENDRVSAQVDGTSIGDVPVNGQLGLMVHDGRVRFKVQVAE